MWLGNGEESEGVISLPDDSYGCLVDVVPLVASASTFFCLASFDDDDDDDTPPAPAPPSAAMLYLELPRNPRRQ